MTLSLKISWLMIRQKILGIAWRVSLFPLQEEESSWDFSSAWSVMSQRDSLWLQPALTVIFVVTGLRKLVYTRSYSCSETVKTRASFLGSPWKIWNIGCVVQLFVSPERNWDLGDFQLIIYNAALGVGF